MCGIAGIIYRNNPGQLGQDMTRMLQSMKHRGPDSTGYALYGPTSPTVLVRYTLADAISGSRGLEQALGIDAAPTLAP